MLRLLLILTICRSVVGQRQTLINLRSVDGKWLSVKEIVQGREYWLHPICLLESARKCDTCREGSELLLSVRFWSDELLIVASDTLRMKGFCQKDDVCHVTPYIAESLVLRDALQRWRTPIPSTPVGGMIPETQEFMIAPSQANRQEDKGNVSLTRESFGSFQLSIVLPDSETPSSGEQLTITGEDLLWAKRLLDIPQAKKENSIIDGKSLRKLAEQLLKMKAKDTNRDLRLKYYEIIHILRRLATNDRLSIPLTRMGTKSITMGLKMSKFFEFSLDPARQLGETKEEDGSLPSFMRKGNLTVTDRLMSNDPTISLLRSQVSKIASMMNATHLMDRQTINLTAINDCYEVKQNKLGANIYFLRSIKGPIECTDDGDTIILNRSGNKTNFNRNWATYEQGIGQVGRGDYFIGLKHLSVLTQRVDVCMRLWLTPWKLSSSPKKAIYDSFSVGPSSENYQMSYELYSGNLVFDVMATMNGQQFSTYDNDNDIFVGNCALRFKSGNWFQSCMKANIFGPYRNDAKSGMCSVGVDASQGDMCSPLASVRMLIRKKENSGGSRRIVFSDIAPQSSCTAKLKLFTVPASGLYKVTIGGATGGRFGNEKAREGGRGAKVVANFYLKKGTKLGTSAGCQGTNNEYSGHGGDASWLVSRSRKTLLAVAGAGGGSTDYQ